MHSSFFLSFLILWGREGGKGVVFFFSYSNSYFARVLREVYYKTIIIFLLLSGRQLDKTESFFW